MQENSEKNEITPDNALECSGVSVSGFPPDHQWKTSLKDSFRELSELAEFLQVQFSQELTNDPHFPLLVTRSFASRMETGNLLDPLLLQVLPDIQEFQSTNEKSDAVGDLHAKRAPGVIHKYQGRVLFILSPVCAVHCRYCFRRHYPYQQDPHSLSDWELVIDSLKTDPSIEEVIFSGGDPLMLSDRRISEIITMLEEIPHLQRLRIHSRLPIVLPDRINKPLVKMLLDSRLSPIMVVHANHPAEIASDCAAGLKRLVRNGITTLNQAVLLHGINEKPEQQEELCRRLINLGVLPYYLHQRDAVAGTKHFDVPVAEGLKLIVELRKKLPGYAVPRYVQEIVGEESKTSLM